MSDIDSIAEVLGCVSQLSVFDSLCTWPQHSACAYVLATQASRGASAPVGAPADARDGSGRQAHLGLVAQPEAWATWGQAGHPSTAAWTAHCVEYIKSQRAMGSAGSQVAAPGVVDATLALLASCTPAHIQACTAAVRTLREYAWGQHSARSAWLSSTASAALARAAGACWPVAQHVLAAVERAQRWRQDAASCLVCSVVLPHISTLQGWSLQELLGVGVAAPACSKCDGSEAAADVARDSQRALQWCMAYRPAALFWTAGRCFAARPESCACRRAVMHACMQLAAQLANLQAVVEVSASTGVRDACNAVRWQPMELGIAAAADLQAAVGMLLLQLGDASQSARGLQLLACRWRLLSIRDSVLDVPSEPAEWQPLASRAPPAAPLAAHAVQDPDAPLESAPAGFPLFDPLNFSATKDVQPVPQRQQRRLTWHDALHSARAQLSAHAHSTTHSTRHVGWWQGTAMLVEWAVLAAATSCDLTVGPECVLRDLGPSALLPAMPALEQHEPQPLQLSPDAVAQVLAAANYQVPEDVPMAMQVAWHCLQWAAWHCLLWSPGLDEPAFQALVHADRGTVPLAPAVHRTVEEMGAGFAALLTAMPGLEHVKVCAQLDQYAVSTSGDAAALGRIWCIVQHTSNAARAQAAAGRLAHLTCMALLDGASQPPAVLLAALEGICACAALWHTPSSAPPAEMLPVPAIPDGPPHGSAPPACWSATCRVLVHFAQATKMARVALHGALLDAIAACALCADEASLCAAWLALALAGLARHAALPLAQVWDLPTEDALLWACPGIPDAGLPALAKAAQETLQRYLAAMARNVSGVTHPVFRLLLAWAGRPAKFLAVDQYVQLQSTMRDAAVLLLLPLALDSPDSAAHDWPAPAPTTSAKRTPRLLLHEMDAAGIRAWTRTCTAAWEAWAASMAQAGSTVAGWGPARWVSCGSRCAAQLLVRLYLATAMSGQGSSTYHSHIRGALLAAGSLLQGAETSSAYTHSLGSMAYSKLYQKAARHAAGLVGKSLHRKRRRQGAGDDSAPAGGQASPASADTPAVHPLAWMTLGASAVPALTSRNPWVLALAAADGESGDSYADMDDFFAGN